MCRLCIHVQLWTQANLFPMVMHCQNHNIPTKRSIETFPITKVHRMPSRWVEQMFTRSSPLWPFYFPRTKIRTFLCYFASTGALPTINNPKKYVIKRTVAKIANGPCRSFTYVRELQTGEQMQSVSGQFPHIIPIWHLGFPLQFLVEKFAIRTLINTSRKYRPLSSP